MLSCIASALAMQLGEPSRWHASQAAVRSDLVVVRSQDRHGCSGLVQALKPALVEVLVAELAIEARDVAVLHRAPRLDQDVASAMRLRPGHEGPAGELRAVVGSHRLRVPTKQRSSIQYQGHVLARDAEVHRDLHTLMAEIVGHREVLQAPPAREAVAHEIHAPHLVDRACQLQRHTLIDRPLALLAPAHSQAVLAGRGGTPACG